MVLFLWHFHMKTVLGPAFFALGFWEMAFCHWRFVPISTRYGWEHIRRSKGKILKCHQNCTIALSANRNGHGRAVAMRMVNKGPTSNYLQSVKSQTVNYSSHTIFLDKVSNWCIWRQKSHDWFQPQVLYFYFTIRINCTQRCLP